MIKIKYNGEVSVDAFDSNLNRINNQLYKILCYKEEDKEWSKPLTTIITELIGMKRLFPSEVIFLSVISKLEGLFEVEKFEEFRRTIFECMSLLDKEREDVRIR